ncbi:hypothetical protein lerEdw1_010229 [Lerista edwardsae]|nr:hypothetical protein lerEdw1_010229 [Lerista edwardsae]
MSSFLFCEEEARRNKGNRETDIPIKGVLILVHCSYFLSPPTAAFTLDPDHKHPELIISQDHRRAQLQPALPPKTVTHSGTLMVVGKEGYASGKHYWELGVGDTLDWELGVLTQAARDKVKKEKFSGPLGEGCWALRSSREGFFTHQDGEKIEKKEVSYEKIGMFLDREHGTITFYNAEIMFLISSIPTQSNERLYPFLSFVKAGEDANQSPLEVIHRRIPVPLKAPKRKKTFPYFF